MDDETTTREDIRELADAYSRKAVEILVRVMMDEGQNSGDRLRAAIYLLEVAGVVGFTQELD